MSFSNELFKLIEFNFYRIDLIKKFLSDSNENLNLYNVSNKTPLHIAVTKSIKIVTLLLEKDNINPNLPDGNGNTPLHIAVAKNLYNIVEMLIEDGRVDLNAKNNMQKTALHIAVEKGNYLIVELLIKSRVNINILDSDSNTPLRIAVIKANNNILKLLLSQPNFKLNSNTKKENICHLAAVYGNGKTIRILVKRFEEHLSNNWSELNISHISPISLAIMHSNRETFTEMIKIEEALKVKNKMKINFVHVAAINCNRKMMKLVLSTEEGYNLIESRDIKGSTPLMKAIINKNNDAVEVLLEKGANVSSSNCLGTNVLHYVAAMGDYLVIDTFFKLRKELNFNVEDSKGRTPLHLAFIQKKTKNIEKIIKYVGLNFNPKKIVDSILENSYEKGAEILMSKGVNLNQNYNKYLFKAIEEDNLELAKTANHFRIDINSKNSEGKTPIYLATETLKLDMIEFLLKNGADPNIRCCNGETPLFLLHRKFNLNVMKLLVNITNLNLKNGNGLKVSEITDQKDSSYFLRYLTNLKNKIT